MKRTPELRILSEEHHHGLVQARRLRLTGEEGETREDDRRGDARLLPVVPQGTAQALPAGAGRASRARPWYEDQTHVQGQQAEARGRPGADARCSAPNPRSAEQRPRPAYAGRVRRVVARGAGARETVFLSSHQVPEVERIADRVAIISDGSKDGLMTHLCVAKLIHITLHSGRSACRSRWDQRSGTQKSTLPNRTVRLDHGKTSLRPLFCEWPPQRKACR
jgi:hypothetical protein